MQSSFIERADIIDIANYVEHRTLSFVSIQIVGMQALLNETTWCLSEPLTIFPFKTCKVDTAYANYWTAPFFSLWMSVCMFND